MQPHHFLLPFIPLSIASQATLYAPSSSSSLAATAPETLALLADKLGVSRHHTLNLNVQDADDLTRTTVVLGALDGEDAEGWFTKGSKKENVVLISVAGYDEPLPERTPALVLEEELGMGVVRLASEMQVEFATGKAVERGEGFCVVAPRGGKTGDVESPAYDDWLVGKVNTEEGLTEDMLAVFSPEKKAHQDFLQEYFLLRRYTTDVLASLKEGSKVVCQFNSLQQLVDEKNADPEVYGLAVSLFTSLLTSKSLESALLLTTPSASNLSKRNTDESTLSLTPPTRPSALESAPVSSSTASPTSPATPLKPSVPRCFKSESACTDTTNSCSSHGTCKLFSGCWSCHCSSTGVIREGESNKTTYWAGNACQKKDVSVPFNIFAIFTITMFLIIGSTIGLLYSMGEEELPGVLSSGVSVGPKRS